VPSYSPTKIVQIIKSLTAREIFHRVPPVKKRLIDKYLSCVRQLDPIIAAKEGVEAQL